MRGLVKYILIGLGLLFLLILIFTPSIIRSYLVKNSPELIGRQIELEKLKYNYFTSTVKAFDFKMFEDSQEDVFVSFDTLILDLDPLRYFQDEKVIEQFYIKGLFTQIIMDESGFNFDDLIDFHTNTDTLDVESEEEETEFKYEISKIQLKGAHLIFDNRTVGKVNDIPGIDFFVPMISWDQTEKSSADIAFAMDRGGSFEANFNFDPKSGDFDTDVEVKKLYLDPFYEYVREYALINSFDGYVDAKVHLAGNINEYQKVVAAVDAKAFDFEMRDTTDRVFLGAKESRFIADNLDSYNAVYHINSIEIIDSYTYFQLDSNTNNFYKIFMLEDELESSDSGSDVTADTLGGQSLSYSIDEFILRNGRLDYSDNLTGQPFNYKLSNIEFDTKDIDSNSERFTINSTMLLNDRGNLTAAVDINPQDFNNLSLDIAVENFLLPDLNIYTEYYMGHSTVTGDMYYYCQTKIVEGQIESENKLIVRGATLETSDAGLYSIPLKFAFFLLTDRNGDVELDIPVRGDLNDPSISVGKIVWDTFKNVIDKTVLAPVDFLVGLVGGDPKELEEMEFTFSDTIPNNKQYRQLEKLLDLERQKEGLAITMDYFVDERLFTEAIAVNMVGEEFNSKRRDYTKQTEEFEKYVRKQTGKDSISVTDAIMELTKDQNVDSIRDARIQSMIDKVIDFLESEGPDNRIKVQRGDQKAPENIGAYPTFKITYDMLEKAVLDSTATQ
ncbi:DUF748 domain-containing protein [Algoriphagus sediminis]|uniref:DUF748 domain-containing protein n=1 Tax=Algoriphagus sediminis TaxID=3057113 RepID=A0ABT7Y9M1_9BACT|nr:DUF748 domain-containing protein [Algoriphagus sediminis]MDN3203200.1 DUF748 domain-containing protein [Algoriphagus sediminis]